MSGGRYAAPPPVIEPWEGLLLVDKPAGMTSHDVVDAIRRRFGFRKVGHGGTLDPMATGLLVILLGRGTKLSDRVMASDKTYEGTLKLGATTDTEDVDGQILAEAPWEHVTREAVEREMAARVGDLMQTPPMVSAVKKQGVPLYKLARKGQTVEREPRLIHVYEFRLLAFEPPRARFVLRCTKGTYVRTLCADIGRALGCGAFLEALRRTRAGALAVEAAAPLDDILRMDVDRVAERVLPLHGFLAGGSPG
ncbi:MAG TPA: tRNA pseudouridine(55) synthase TruB [Kiritimatiellia bacterium]|nr:tRNA pseudouridine(55) synthase TruB [Kiritimatiellia bacterium]HRZ11600.1 tRNA pseudouridine(55) synthase TruB [Kiritimatiellia bacterium]HSA16849.1 tRNA pseudouridine(55) synthase TruB [Kiritimatiellia bacterium]